MSYFDRTCVLRCFDDLSIKRSEIFFPLRCPTLLALMCIPLQCASSLFPPVMTYRIFPLGLEALTWKASFCNYCHVRVQTARATHLEVHVHPYLYVDHDADDDNHDYTELWFSNDSSDSSCVYKASCYLGLHSSYQFQVLKRLLDPSFPHKFYIGFPLKIKWSNHRKCSAQFIPKR